MSKAKYTKYKNLCKKHSKNRKSPFKLVETNKCGSCLARNAYNKEYYKLNKERRKDYLKQWHLKNRSKNLKKSAVYNKANKKYLNALNNVRLLKARVQLTLKKLNKYKSKLAKAKQILKNEKPRSKHATPINLATVTKN